MSKPRSLDQHRRLFALIAAAFDQWPHAHPFRPENAEHLRAWLLVRARHCIVNTYYLNDEAGEHAKLFPLIAASMFRQWCWAKSDGNALHICMPASIAFDKLSHADACRIFDDVGAVIEGIFGVEPDQLLKEREMAA